MKKKVLNSLLLVVLAMVATTTMFSCKDYDDDIKGLQEQIDENKRNINQINSLITNGSVITDVTKNGEGIIITLSNGQSYPITNGTNGKDAVVWTIGDDGYWYKDGAKTNYYALGKDGTNGKDGKDGVDGKDGKDGVDGKDGKDGVDGKDGKDGVDGKDGKDGVDGKDGKDGKDGTNGIYYYPNPETGNFDIYNADGTFKESTNISWKATVENAITAVMDKDVLKLYGVQTNDGPKMFEIALSNALRGFVFAPETYVDGVPAIEILSYSYGALTLKNKDNKSGTETWTAATAKTTINPTVYAEYHVNPSNANVEDLKKLKFVVRPNDKYISTRRNAKASTNFNATAEFESFKDGILKVKVNITGVPATADYISVIALQTTKDNGEDVTSDYATVYKNDMEDLRIAMPTNKAPEKKDYHYRRWINAIDSEAGAPVKSSKCWDVDGACDLTMYYGDRLDVASWVEAHLLKNPHTGANLEKLGMKFEYELVKNFIIGTNGTDQAEYVTLTDGVMAVKPEYGTSAIERTPIIRVLLKEGSKIVKVAYIKVKISRQPGTQPENFSYTLPVNEFTFQCGTPGMSKTTYQQTSKYVYAVLNLSKKEFHEQYPNFEDTVDPNDVGTIEEKNEDDNATEEGTHILQWTISEADLWKHAGDSVFNIVRYYDAAKKTYVQIKLASFIKGITKSYTIGNDKKINNYWNPELTYAKFNVAVPTSPTDSDPNNCVFVNDLNAPFKTKDGIIDLNIAAVTDFYFTFCDDMKGKKSIGGKSYTFAVSDDGLTLTCQGQTIATIQNNNTTAPFNTVTYNKDSELAKELLNTGEMYALFKVIAHACNDESKEIEIKFGNDDHFRANFIRPINIAGKAADNFIDGVDFGEKGSYIDLADLISPSDWRNRNFKDYENYWDFYGPFSVEVSLNDIKCDLNGQMQTLPATLIVEQQATPWNGHTSKFGFLTYKNNGTVVTKPFNMYVSVTVKYGWGEIKTAQITVPVKVTI